jgi:lysophospholipase L1-like esterase
MKRLVYSPSVKVWVKTDFGVIDLSPYITHCDIQRKIDDVSKLRIAFRNPRINDNGKPRFMFTEKVRDDGSIGPVFHPMDPITVSMERIAGKPIQVFTGYCDTVPYVQLFPGTGTITASCTLKRLQHTYWDAGLPFVQEFLRAYGWLLGGDGTVKNSGTLEVPAEEKRLAKLIEDGNYSAVKDVNLNDGSIGNLLYAVLNEIGGWDSSNIYIQPLPSNLSSIVAKLMSEFTEENKKINEEVVAFLEDLIGSGEFGTALGAGNGDSSNVAAGGGDVTMIGDSITNMSKSQLEAKLPGITIYAQNGKHMDISNSTTGDSGLKILSDHKSSLGNVVVIALGSNDHDTDTAKFKQQISSAMKKIGSTRTAVFVTVTNNDKINKAIKDSQSSYSNLKIADWKAKAELSSDNLHPTEHGKAVFAKTVADVVSTIIVNNAPSGTAVFDGVTMAAWIKPILVWARAHGWRGTVTSGYRSHAYNVSQGRNYNSNHESTAYPGGAIDVGGYGAQAEGKALNDVLKNYPGSPKLVWGAVIEDYGHFSATGH